MSTFVYKFFMVFAVLQTTVSSSMSQQVIEILMCDEMIDDDFEKLIKISLISKGDTLSFPELGRNRYVYPLRPCHEPILNYDRGDASLDTLLLENSKYSYFLDIYRRDLHCERIELCIEDEKNQFGESKWKYQNCVSMTSAGFVKPQTK